MTTTTTTEPRRVLRGTLNETTGVYTLFLDNGTEVDTESAEIATTASKAAKANQWLLIETERKGGRSVITELSIAPAAPAKPEAAHANADGATSEKASAGSAPGAIAKRPDLPVGLISDAHALAEQLTAFHAHYNVLSPAVAVSQMAPGFGANLAVVVIDPTITLSKDGKSGSGPDCYWSSFLFQGDKEKRALNKQGLLKISQAAGIQWDPMHCRRLDDGKERFYWRWQYYGGIRTHDGQWQPLTGTRELDLRDGSGEAANMASSNQLAQQRARGNEICETKAMQRAIRSLGIKQVYTVEELRKPFLLTRFSFTPDMNDPEIKKFVTQQAMSGIGQLYQTSAAPMLPPAPEVADLTIADDKPAQAASQKKPNPFQDEAPAAASESAATMPDGGTTIVDVKPARSKPGATGRPWVRYDVTFATGEIASTFNEAMQRAIDNAFRQKLRVRITTSEVEGHNDKIETLETLDSRQQGLPDPGAL